MAVGRLEHVGGSALVCDETFYVRDKLREPRALERLERRLALNQLALQAAHDTELVPLAVVQGILYRPQTKIFPEGPKAYKTLGGVSEKSFFLSGV